MAGLLTWRMHATVVGPRINFITVIGITDEQRAKDSFLCILRHLAKYSTYLYSYTEEGAPTHINMK